MAYTILKNIDLNTSGGGYPFYFHKGDVDKIYEKYSEIEAVQIRKARYPKGVQGREIFVLVGVHEVGANPTNPPVFEKDDAIVALPCPPLEIEAGQYLNENGDPRPAP